MAKPNYIELGDAKHTEKIPILYEDRSVLAIDKPAGWMLIPFSWQKTNRNLQAAITSSIAAGDFWARSRNLKHLRNVHRLDAETSGVLLFAKSPGALNTYSDLFESRKMEKRYLAVVYGVPKESQWTCRLSLSQDSTQFGRMKVDARHGKEAETHFTFLQSHNGVSLIEARPFTGRTHQIRIHLMESGYPIVGDPIYRTTQNRGSGSDEFPMALRALQLAYVDPFQRRQITIKAPAEAFCRAFGFPEIIR